MNLPFFYTFLLVSSVCEAPLDNGKVRSMMTEVCDGKVVLSRLMKKHKCTEIVTDELYCTKAKWMGE